MKKEFIDFSAWVLAVTNGGLAIWFAANIVANPGFTDVPARAAPESAIGVVFCLFLWVAVHAAVFIAILMEREA